MDKLGVPDLRGDYVKAGDTIAYGAVDGRSGMIRIGNVIEIVWEHQTFQRWDNEKKYPDTAPTKLRVQVEYSSGYSLPGKPTLIEAGFKRFVKLG
jgi:hypothetical protein